MEDSSSSSKSGGIGFCGLLTIVFIVLKLGVANTEVQEWSWWWVLAPLWMPLGILIGILALVFIVSFAIIIVTLVEKIKWN